MLKETLQFYTIFSFCVVRMRSISITSIVHLQCGNEFYKPIQNCVGSFILPNVVLTTSYCAENCQYIENSPIIRSYIHPHYKNFIHGNNFFTRNDIGLVVIPEDKKKRKFVKLSALDSLSTIGQKALIPVLNTNRPRLQVTIVQRCFKEQPFGYYVCAANKMTKRSIQICRERQEQGMPLLLEGKIYGITGITSSDSCALPQLSFTAISPALFWISETVRTLGYDNAVIPTLHHMTTTRHLTTRSTRPYPSPVYPTGTPPTSLYPTSDFQSDEYLTTYYSSTTSYPETTHTRSRLLYSSPVYPTGSPPTSYYEPLYETVSTTSTSTAFTDYTNHPSTHSYPSPVYPTGTPPKFTQSYDTEESTTTLKSTAYTNSKKPLSTRPYPSPVYPTGTSPKSIYPYDTDETTTSLTSTTYSDFTNRPSTSPYPSPVYPTGTPPKWPDYSYSTIEVNTMTSHSTSEPDDIEPHSTYPYPSAVYPTGTPPKISISDPDDYLTENTITASSPATYETKYSKAKETSHILDIYPTGTPPKHIPNPTHSQSRTATASPKISTDYIISKDPALSHPYPTQTYATHSPSLRYSRRPITSSVYFSHPYPTNKFRPSKQFRPTYPTRTTSKIIKPPTQRRLTSSPVVYPTGTIIIRTTTTTPRPHTRRTTLTIYPPTGFQSRMPYNYTTLPYPTGTLSRKPFSTYRVPRSTKPTRTTTTKSHSSPSTFLVYPTGVQSKTTPPTTAKVSYGLKPRSQPANFYHFAFNKDNNKRVLKFLRNSLKYNLKETFNKTKNMKLKDINAMRLRHSTSHVTAITFMPSVTTNRLESFTLPISTSQKGPAEAPKRTNSSVKTLSKSKTTNVMDWFSVVVKNKVKNSTSVFYISSSKVTQKLMQKSFNFLDLT